MLSVAPSALFLLPGSVEGGRGGEHIYIYVYIYIYIVKVRLRKKSKIKALLDLGVFLRA